MEGEEDDKLSRVVKEAVGDTPRAKKIVEEVRRNGGPEALGIAMARIMVAMVKAEMEAQKERLLREVEHLAEHIAHSPQEVYDRPLIRTIEAMTASLTYAIDKGDLVHADYTLSASWRMLKKEEAWYREFGDEEDGEYMDSLKEITRGTALLRGSVAEALKEEVEGEVPE